MTPNKDQAQADLAFMRALVEDGGGSGPTGEVYMWAGLLYGLQCLLNYAGLMGWIPDNTILWLAIGFGPTIIFLIVILILLWKDREAPFGTGAARKALNAAFAGAGIANLLLALIFGWAAYQKNDWAIWLLFPVVVCALQGAVWIVATVLQRRAWFGLTALGWFVMAAVLSLFIDDIPAYLLILGAGLILCMAAPGFMLARSAKRAG